MGWKARNPPAPVASPNNGGADYRPTPNNSGDYLNSVNREAYNQIPNGNYGNSYANGGNGYNSNNY